MINKIMKLIKVIVVISLIISLIFGKTSITFNLGMILVFLFLEKIVRRKIGYSSKVELLIFIFILSTEILGEILRFYVSVPCFDIIIHVFSGIIISALGYYIFNKFSNKNDILIIIFVFFFSMGTSAIWELTEFSIDRILKEDMQKDTVIKEITSYKFSFDDKKPLTEKVDKAILNDIDLVKSYGGYIDIGLYDTMEDMFAALAGTIIYILIYKKSGAI